MLSARVMLTARVTLRVGVMVTVWFRISGRVMEESRAEPLVSPCTP